MHRTQYVTVFYLINVRIKAMQSENLILIYGGNELASAIAVKCFNSGFNTAMYVNNDEVFLRHNLCFGDAIHHNIKTIENVTAETISEDLIQTDQDIAYLENMSNAVRHIIKDRKIPVLHQLPFGDALKIIEPGVIINALYYPLPDHEHSGKVIGLHPHHLPGKDCYLAIESRLSYRLGEIYHPQNQLILDDKPELQFFKDPFAVCNTPIEGVWLAQKEIGEKIEFNETLGKIDDVEIRSPYNGQLWGIVHSGKFYSAKSPVARIYLGLTTENFRYFGFYENAIAGGVLEAVLKILNS